MTTNLNNLTCHSEYDGTDEIHLADGHSMPITHTSTSHCHFNSRDSLHNVLCVPTARRNLLYVHQFTKDNGVSLEFFPNYFIVKDQPTGDPLKREYAVMAFITSGHLSTISNPKKNSLL